jgi:small conductance mechanosensitive channel
LGNPVIAGVETIDVGYVRLRLIARTLPGKQFDVERELRYRVAMALRTAGIVSPTAASGGGG